MLQHLIAKPLLTLNKEKKINVREIEGKFYLFITPKRYIGSGATLEKAITDANCRTFTTGYFVQEA